jgi:hypothetical protein
MKNYILILFSAVTFGQASNQMVSFTQVQSLGFTLNAGQSHVTSNQCMTKSESLAKYNLDASAMGSYANNQLVPRSAWVSGIVGLNFQLIETTLTESTGATWANVCAYSWSSPLTKYTKTGLIVGEYIYNDIGCTNVLQIVGKSYKVLENGIYKRLAGNSHSDAIEVIEDCSAPPASYYAYSFSASRTSSAQSCALNTFGTTWYSSSVQLDVGGRLFTNTSLTSPVSGGSIWYNCQQDGTAYKIDSSGYIIEFYNCI